MNIFITGGAGYIGSHTVLEALRRNHQVFVFDSLERGYCEAIDRVQALARRQIIFLKGDLRNREDIAGALQDTQPDIVIHFAAYKSVGEGEKEPDKYYKNNVEATIILLEEMIRNKIKKIIFSSSAATYGIVNQMPITEQSPTNPISVYGRTKLEMEKIIDNFTKTYGLESVAFRYFNAVGADESGEIGEDPRYSTNLVPLVMQTLVGKREKVFLFGNRFDTADGTQERDYIHVSDLATAHLDAAEKSFNQGEMVILNLSTGKKTSCLEIFKLAEEISGRKLNYEVIDPRPGDPVTLYADNSKAKFTLGWEPKRDIKKSIQDQWRWTSKYPNGYNY